MNRSAYVLLALCLVACETGGSETGNPVATQMGLGLRTGDPGVIGIRSGEGGAVLQEAWLAFGEVTFLGPEQCANFGEIDVIGPTKRIADLTRENQPLSFELSEPSHCGLAVPLNPSNDDLPRGAPAALGDHDIVLRGERADGTRFELLHSEQETLELKAEGGQFRIERGGPDLLLSFDVAQWLNRIDLDSTEPGDDGVIHIDEPNNPALIEAFETNLECSLQLFSDQDDDGAVGDDDPVLARCIPD
jgi:hypothetical protein